jgi:photosystem II Psb27 protein
MKRYWSLLLSIVLVIIIGLMGFPSSANADTLTGNYSQDTLTVVNILKDALELPDDAPDRGASQTQARQKINEFAARYQRNNSVASLNSFTTMRTVLNSLAGHYSSYPNRPVPQKLKDRLQEEFVQIESALRRGA